MIVLITGATGFIGGLLCERLAAAGHSLRMLTRNPTATSRLPNPSGKDGARAYAWDPEKPAPAQALAGADAVVHLAGESIGAWPWTAERKRRILDSRINGTRSLVEGMRDLAANGERPRILVAASAVGYYGNGGEESLAETHAPGQGFLAEVCVAWEREIFRARELGLRTVAVRNGLVLGRGGVLRKLLPIYRLGGGAVLGSGRQWWSWIHVEDTVGIFAHALSDTELEGPVNGCAPQPVTQREFALALAKAAGRPLWLRAPAFVLEMALGEMAATLLEGQKTDASKLAGRYAYRYRTLDAALENIVTGG
ncbi:MAG: TIGR01777 family oxidoreductase [Fibrobacteria bacterium]